MPRLQFENELERMQDELLNMSSMVIYAMRDSVKVLKTQNLIGAKRLIADDRKINTMRYKNEEDALLLIATQQPVASDTRLIAA